MANDQHSKTLLRELRGPLAGLFLCVLVALGAAVAIWQWRLRIEAALDDARRALGASQARLAQADNEVSELSALIERFRRLQASGRIEPEHRLEWAETFVAIRQERLLPALDFEISPQRPLFEKDKTGGKYEFRASAMRMTLPLIHEGDLLGFFADLQNRISALSVVKRCRIEAMPPERREYPLASLAADCEIDLITIQERT